MLRYIHTSWSIEKYLRGLRKSGKKAELAVRKCEAIINDIRVFGCQHETVSGKRTRNGEFRIKNCIKYDLGAGYRLVTIKLDSHLFITFVGSHDETDQWIEHHRYDTFAPDNLLYRSEETVIQPDKSQTADPEGTHENIVNDEYKNELTAKLNESQLKSIFQGLFAPPL
ncbi:MAG: hypothetical protein V2B20_20065 [Pseudomonadota bacterium]